MESTPGTPSDKGMSQVQMAFAILQETGEALHINEIIDAIRARFDATVDRESLVSAMTKKVARDQMFVRTAPNTFQAR